MEERQLEGEGRKWKEEEQVKDEEKREEKVEGTLEEQVEEGGSEGGGRHWEGVEGETMSIRPR